MTVPQFNQVVKAKVAKLQTQARYMMLLKMSKHEVPKLIRKIWGDINVNSNAFVQSHNNVNALIRNWQYYMRTRAMASFGI